MRYKGIRKPEDNYNWAGGRKVHKGYVMLLMHGHPMADKNGYVSEHAAIVIKAIGKPLPPGAEIHHVNENRADNRGNLVVCQDRAYHLLLHTRRKALMATGNPNLRLCCWCHKWMTIDQFYKSTQGERHGACKGCMKTYATARKRRLAMGKRGAL